MESGVNLEPINRQNSALELMAPSVIADNESETGFQVQLCLTKNEN